MSAHFLVPSAVALAIVFISLLGHQVEAAKTNATICAKKDLTKVGADTKWNEWKRAYRKRYGDQATERKAYEAFLGCQCYVTSLHKTRKDKGEVHFDVLASVHCGLPNDEFIHTRLGGSYQQASPANNSQRAPVIFLTPEARQLLTRNDFNWKLGNKVSPVRDQGRCASSWSFSAVGALEGHLAIQSGTMIPLSNQNLIDCSKSFKTKGCKGGLPQDALEYVHSTKGVNTYDAYPFTATDDGTCKASASALYGTLEKDQFYVTIPKGNETALLQAVALGPVSAGIDASPESFRLYKSGVYDDPKCSSKSMNHALLIVGWGVDRSNPSKPLSFWLVKNSWGTQWGESGYMRIKRGVNMCGIANSAVYPLLQLKVNAKAAMQEATVAPGALVAIENAQDAISSTIGRRPTKRRRPNTTVTRLTSPTSPKSPRAPTQPTTPTLPTTPTRVTLPVAATEPTEPNISVPGATAPGRRRRLSTLTATQPALTATNPTLPTQVVPNQPQPSAPTFQEPTTPTIGPLRRRRSTVTLPPGNTPNLPEVRSLPSNPTLPPVSTNLPTMWPNNPTATAPTLPVPIQANQPVVNQPTLPPSTVPTLPPATQPTLPPITQPTVPTATKPTITQPTVPTATLPTITQPTLKSFETTTPAIPVTTPKIPERPKLEDQQRGYNCSGGNIPQDQAAKSPIYASGVTFKASFLFSLMVSSLVSSLFL